MAGYEGCGEARFRMISDEACKILDSLDSKALEAVRVQLEKLDIDMDYCCAHPDVLCTILKIACGKSYVDIIRSASGY